MSRALLNLDHCRRKLAHWAGEQPISTFGWVRAGGLRLGLSALGILAGWSAAMWLIIACMAAASLRPTGAWKRQSPSTQARAMVELKAAADKVKVGMEALN